MDENNLKKLFEENKGDIIIKGKDGREWNVISHILKLVSPVFEKMLTYDLEEKRTSVIDLSHYNNENIEVMLRHIYYKNVDSTIGSVLTDPALVCELVHIFDMYEFHELKNELLKWMCEIKDLTNEKNKKFIFSSLNEFPKYGELFQSVQMVYCDYVVTILRNNITFPCYDKVSDFAYGWCCKHKSKPTTDYYNYEINGKYACKYTNVNKYINHQKKRSRTDEKTSLHAKKRQRHDEKNDEKNNEKNNELKDNIVKENYFTDWCCEHRSIFNGPTNSHDYEELIKLPAETMQTILKNLLT